MAIVKFKLSAFTFNLEIEKGVTFNKKNNDWYYNIEKYNVERKIEYSPFIQNENDFKLINSRNFDYVYVEDNILGGYLSWLFNKHIDIFNSFEENINYVKSIINSNDYVVYFSKIYDTILENKSIAINGIATIKIDNYLILSEEWLSFPIDYEYHKSAFDSLRDKNINISHNIDNENNFITYINLDLSCEKNDFIESIKKESLLQLDKDYKKIKNILLNEGFINE